MRKLIVLLIVMLVIISCGASKSSEDMPKVQKQQNISGEVIEVNGNAYTLRLALPEYNKSNLNVVNRIASQVTAKTVVLAGTTIKINGVSAFVERVDGNRVYVTTEKQGVFSLKTSVEFEIPKKSIAIVDFEVIKGKDKSVGKVTLDGLTSALIKENYFNVVERSKLKMVLEEINLSLSGLSKKQVETDLLIADLMLTGSVAKFGNSYQFNLRLINVRTGHAIAAITEIAPFTQLSSIRDAGVFVDDFEKSRMSSLWNLGVAKKRIQYVTLDRNVGYESKQSGVLEFNFSKMFNAKKAGAFIENAKKRDLSIVYRNRV